MSSVNAINPEAKRTHTITLIPGDGIGPEVTDAVVHILEAAGRMSGFQFTWEPFAAGAQAFEKYHEYIPKESINRSSAPDLPSRGR